MEINKRKLKMERNKKEMETKRNGMKEIEIEKQKKTWEKIE